MLRGVFGFLALVFLYLFFFFIFHGYFSVVFFFEVRYITVIAHVAVLLFVGL